jgi:glycine cleavage system H protein
MSELKYTDDHEWLRLEADGTLTIGITTHAQEQLGDIVFVKLPDVGRSIKAGEEAVVIESVKAAADIKMPVSGEVVAVNTLLNDSP